MATAQYIINQALISLRMPQLAGVPVSDGYSLLILQLFNEVKQEVEDATNWRALDQTLNVTLPASSGAGPAGGGYFVVLPGTNERSRLRRVPVKGAGMSQAGYLPAINAADATLPMVFDMTNPSDSGPYMLGEIPLDVLRWKLNTTNYQTAVAPQFFALSPVAPDGSAAGTGEQVLYLFPPVNTDRELKITMVVPQTDFNASLQDSNGKAQLLVPTYPVLAGLKWRAYEERGEELGPSNAFSQAAFTDALADAVGIENVEAGNNVDLSLE